MSDSNYADLVNFREQTIDGLGHWMWVKSDGGSSGDGGAWKGPKEEWEQHHSKSYFKYLRNTNVVVTAGANCGMYSRLFAQKFGVVYAFEPDPLNFYCMVNNNQLDNVIKIQGALGEKNCFVTIHRLTMANVGMHKVVQLPEGYHGTIPMFTVDQFNFPRLDLLQLDVEGYEANALQGARETIKRLKPVISVENNTGKGVLTELGYVHKEASGSIIKDHIWVHEDNL